MAEEQEEQEEQETLPVPKKSKTGLYILIVVIQILVAGFLVWKFVLPEFSDLKDVKAEVLAKSGKAEQADDGENDGGEPRELGTMYKIENLTVNPLGSGGTRFAVVGFSLEVSGGDDDVKELDKYKMVITDRYLSYFRKKSIQELAKASMTDSLKKDLKMLTNEVLGRKVVNNVYFTQYVLQ